MKFGFVNKDNMSILTDLYELTMAQVYLKDNMTKTAIFDFYIRPAEKRSFFISSGLEQLLYYIKNIKFTDEDLNYLKSLGFEDFFLDYLKNFKFTGDIYAIEEGEIIFPNEPVVQIEAPLPEAQIIETFLINTLQHPILVATKAIRCYIAGNKEKILVDFGLRRTHGTDAGMKAARASYIGGFAGTSNVLAGKEYGIPVFGTMAHSFILAYGDEIKAFEAFAKQYPENTIFLIDTFDSIEGVKKAIKVAKKLGMETFKGVRIDSGDLVELSKKVRKILDEYGYKDAKIIASGGINEYIIKEHVKENAPIDGYGVGTELVVSADLPYLDCAYKLVEYDGNPVMKFSPKKITLPSKKQVYRFFSSNGKFSKDIVAVFDEKFDGKPLLKKVVENGKVCIDLPDINSIREKVLKNIENLPENLLKIGDEEQYIPEISPKLNTLVNKLREEILNG